MIVIINCGVCHHPSNSPPIGLERSVYRRSPTASPPPGDLGNSQLCIVPQCLMFMDHTHTHTHTQWAHQHQSLELSPWKRATTPTALLATRAPPSLPTTTAVASQPHPPLQHLMPNPRCQVAGQTKHPLKVRLPANGAALANTSKLSQQNR